MRLICPNCGAQYDVPVDVIPEAGRDVQCSNCGHTWFQRHPDDDAALAEDLELPVPDPEWEPEAEDEDEAPAPPPVDAPEPQRRVDPEMAEIFREEREFESRRRSADTLESQPDLGLSGPDEDEQARRSRQARERMVRMRGTAETPEPSTPRPDDGEAAAMAAAAAAAGSRRDLLPDVDEINQSLRSSHAEPRVIDSAKDETTRRARDDAASGGGFGKGFLTMVVLIGGAVALYAFAPAIVETVPALAPAMDSYVTAVDQGRAWLDEQVTALMTTLDAMSSEAQTESPDTAPPADATPPAETAPPGEGTPAGD